MFTFLMKLLERFAGNAKDASAIIRKPERCEHIISGAASHVHHDALGCATRAQYSGTINVCDAHSENATGTMCIYVYGYGCMYNMYTGYNHSTKTKGQIRAHAMQRCGRNECRQRHGNARARHKRRQNKRAGVFGATRNSEGDEATSRNWDETCLFLLSTELGSESAHFSPQSQIARASCAKSIMWIVGNITM